jgi:error-prone DNA polymerase
MLEGKLQMEGEVIHVIVQRCHDISKMLRHLTPSQKEAPQIAAFAFPDRSPEPIQKKGAENVFPESRNFK